MAHYRCGACVEQCVSVDWLRNGKVVKKYCFYDNRKWTVKMLRRAFGVAQCVGAHCTRRPIRPDEIRNEIELIFLGFTMRNGSQVLLHTNSAYPRTHGTQNTLIAVIIYQNFFLVSGVRLRHWIIAHLRALSQNGTSSNLSRRWLARKRLMTSICQLNLHVAAATATRHERNAKKSANKKSLTFFFSQRIP